MTIGKQNIIEVFEQNNKPYFAIFYKGKIETGSAITRNDKEDAEHDVTSGRMQFEKFLTCLGPAEYSLVLSETKDVTKRGGLRIDFKIPHTEATAAAQAQPQAVGVGYVSQSEVQQIANDIAVKRFEELMLQKDVKELKEKNAQLEKDLREADKKVSDPWNKFISGIAPHSDKIIGAIFPTVATAPAIARTVVSGVPADATGDGTQDAQKIFEDFCEALQAAKPNEWQNILQQLTKLIIEEPNKFEMALTFLK